MTFKRQARSPRVNDHDTSTSIITPYLSGDLSSLTEGAEKLKNPTSYNTDTKV